MYTEIKRWDNGEVIHSGDFKSIKDCLLDGVSSGISFEYADLRGADLREADLRGADLRYTKGIYIFNAYDTSKRTVYCVKHDDTFMCKAGCFYGTLDELEAKVLARHKSKVYLGNIAIMRELLKDNK